MFKKFIDNKKLGGLTALFGKTGISTKITRFDSPVHFRDEQINGIFKFMKHDHYFATGGYETIMKDNFYFQSPLKLLGKLVDMMVLKKYLTGLLIKRNEIIKQFAESEAWKTVLP